MKQITSTALDRVETCTLPISEDSNAGMGTGAIATAATTRPEATHSAVAARSEPARIPALDFTKGALVVIMVLYHWLNYFVTVGGFGYRYLRFLTPSFIFITGFFVSYVYLSKYKIDDARLPKRLFSRGLKLIGIFVVLNAAILFLSIGNATTLLTNWSYYLTGRTGESRAAFSVLLPIGYLLVLAAGLVVVARVFRNAFQVATVVMLASVFILSAYGISDAFLELVTIGLIGVWVGHGPIGRTNTVAKHPYWLLLMYLGYLLAITVWNEQFWLQVVGVCLSLSVIYVVGLRNEPLAKVRQTIILLGQYSLLGYIVQIVILQALRRGLQPLSSAEARTAIALVSGLGLTVGSVVFVHWIRRRMKLVDALYRAVFA